MMLDVQGLRTGYGRIPILNGVSFSVGEGEFIGILGHNGMGKTTLLQGIDGISAGHRRARACSIGRTSRRPNPIAARGSGIGYVPQGREIFPGLTVYDNLRMGCSKQGGREQDIIDAVLQEFPRLEDAARSARRRAVGRRAATAGDRALPLRPAAARAARRADRRHPALDHRRDHRDPAAAARQAAGSP